MNHRSESPLVSLRKIVAEELPRLESMTAEQKQNLWNNTVSYFTQQKKPLPLEILSLNNPQFKMDLAYDETFCYDVAIPYSEIDNYWDDIRAAVALFYHGQLAA